MITVESVEPPPTREAMREAAVQDARQAENLLRSSAYTMRLAGEPHDAELLDTALDYTQEVTNGRVA
jgi:hypothetical protein